MKTHKNILVAFVLNLIFSVFEFVGGLFTGSIAIQTDSLHDFGDALSIGLSYFLEKKSNKNPDAKHTYGYIRYSVLGGFITSSILLVGSVFVIYESIKRIINPVSINYDGMIAFGIVGVVINFISFTLTKEGHSINQKAVNLHMLEDVLGWIIVLFGSILMKFTNIVYIDSFLSIIVAIFIFVNVCKNLKMIIDLFLEKSPININIEKLTKALLEIDGVCDIHHLHVRSIDGYNNLASFHVVVKEYSYDIKQQLKEELLAHSIGHSTIELELENEVCKDKTCKIKHSHHHHH